MVTEGRKDEVLVVSDSPNTYCGRMGQLQYLRKNRTFCDVVLQVENSEIYAHRSVLACASPYFFELFTADDEVRTATEDKLIYKLNGGFDKDSVERLVSYAYTGELEVPSSLAKSLYIAANKLKMENIAKSCGEHLVASLTPDSCLGIRALPGIAANSKLVAKVDHYIQQQTDLAQVTRETLGVPRILVTVIHGSKDEASMTSRALCSLALEWVQKQIEEEDISVQMLKEKTHLLYLNLDNSFHDCVEIQPGAANDTEIVQDYKKKSRKLSKPNMKLSPLTPQMKGKISGVAQPAKPRMMLFSRSISDDDHEQEGDWKLIAHSKVGDTSVVAIVTLNNTVAVLSIQQQLSPPTQNGPIEASSRPPSVEKVDSYTLIPHMSSPKCASGVGTLNGRLLVCGGYDRGECLIGVEAYDPDRNCWTPYREMKHARGRFDLTVLGGKAYAVGGCNGARELDSVEVFDGEALRWGRAAPLPLARSNTGVCCLNGQVFCIGGWNGQFGIKQCDEYDPRTQIWTTIAPLHTGRYQAGVASLGGKVYAVGGCDSWNCLSSVEVYDPLMQVWRYVAPMNTPRRGCGLAVLNDKLYVVGGSDGTQSLCTTEIYDPDSNTWAAGPSMTICRANVGVAVLKGRLYAVGGFSGKNFLNGIEFLDPQTQEWTNFTPKPEVLRSVGPLLEAADNGRCHLATNGIGDHSDRELLESDDTQSDTHSDDTQGDLDSRLILSEDLITKKTHLKDALYYEALLQPKI